MNPANDEFEDDGPFLLHGVDLPMPADEAMEASPQDSNTEPPATLSLRAFEEGEALLARHNEALG